MKQIPSQKHHVHISTFGQTHDFVEAFPAVVAADGVAFAVADVAVGCDEDFYGVLICFWELVEVVWGGQWGVWVYGAYGKVG